MIWLGMFKESGSHIRKHWYHRQTDGDKKQNNGFIVFIRQFGNATVSDGKKTV